MLRHNCLRPFLLVQVRLDNNNQRARGPSSLRDREDWQLLALVLVVALPVDSHPEWQQGREADKQLAAEAFPLPAAALPALQVLLLVLEESKPARLDDL